MIAGLEFRPYAPLDFGLLAMLAQALYDEDPNVEGFALDKLRATVEVLWRCPDKGRVVMFAFAERVVGYAIVIDFWSNEYGGDIATIDELYVLPEDRGRGVGNAFIEWLADTCPPTTRALALEVTARNARAQELYQRIGFEPDTTVHMMRRL